MANLTAGKIAEVLFEKAIETHEHQDMMLDLVTVIEPDPAKMQNSGDVFWQPVQQYAPVLDGWDLAGKETDIIEELCPSYLETPKGDFVKQRIDNLRDMRFWERRGEEAGKQQATYLNSQIADKIALYAPIYYSIATDSGYEFVAKAQQVLDERQVFGGQRYFMLNNRENYIFSSELSGRQTLQGRPEQVWKKGQIGQNIAGFDVFVGSFLPNIPSATGAMAAAGAQSFKPQGGSVSGDKTTVVNVDYRTAVLNVTGASQMQPGVKVEFNQVSPVSLSDKNAIIETDKFMTFTVLSAVGTLLTICPKPIALNDPNLSDLEKRYSNVDKQIVDLNECVCINYADRANLFWDKEAVEVLNGPIPGNLFKSFQGSKVLEKKMKNGISMYMFYDGNIEDMTFRYRLFTRWGITVIKPMNCGVAHRLVTP